MVVLAGQERSRVYFHLGYGSGAGIPTGDLARLEEAMDTVRDSYQLARIREILNRCDEAWTASKPGTGGAVSKELISGDINRSVIRTTDPYRAQEIAYRDYLRETDNLAQELWVANYRQEVHLRYRFERSGGEHINLLKGVADTAVGAAQYELSNNAGGFGLPTY